MFHKAPPAPPRTSDGAPRKRVLVADDDDATLEIVSTKLRREGYEVHQAHTGDEALAMRVSLRRADTWHADLDLLVLDVHMPRGSGISVLRKLRAESCATPVVLMTGDADPELRVLAQALRAQLLAKPFSLALLSDAAARAVAQRS